MVVNPKWFKFIWFHVLWAKILFLALFTLQGSNMPCEKTLRAELFSISMLVGVPWFTVLCLIARWFPIWMVSMARFSRSADDFFTCDLGRYRSLCGSQSLRGNISGGASARWRSCIVGLGRVVDMLSIYIFWICFSMHIYVIYTYTIYIYICIISNIWFYHIDEYKNIHVYHM